MKRTDGNAPPEMNLSAPPIYFVTNMRFDPAELRHCTNITDLFDILKRGRDILTIPCAVFLRTAAAAEYVEGHNDLAETYLFADVLPRLEVPDAWVLCSRCGEFIAKCNRDMCFYCFLLNPPPPRQYSITNKNEFVTPPSY
jgi:hypothetical protein